MRSNLKLFRRKLMIVPSYVIFSKSENIQGWVESFRPNKENNIFLISTHTQNCVLMQLYPLYNVIHRVSPNYHLQHQKLIRYS